MRILEKQISLTLLTASSLALLGCCAFCASWCCSQCSPTTGISSLFPAPKLWLFLHSSHHHSRCLSPIAAAASLTYVQTSYAGLCGALFHSSSREKLEGLAERQEGEGSGRGVGTSQGWTARGLEKQRIKDKIAISAPRLCLVPQKVWHWPIRGLESTEVAHSSLWGVQAAHSWEH